MKWKSIFKKQALLLLLVGAVVFSPGASASARSGQNGSGNPAIAAPVKVTGKVTDANGNPMPGVTVMVKGTSTGTVTDADGKFELANIKPGVYTLVASFIGFETQKVFEVEVFPFIGCPKYVTLVVRVEVAAVPEPETFVCDQSDGA